MRRGASWQLPNLIKQGPLKLWLANSLSFLNPCIWCNGVGILTYTDHYSAEWCFLTFLHYGKTNFLVVVKHSEKKKKKAKKVTEKPKGNLEPNVKCKRPEFINIWSIDLVGPDGKPNPSAAAGCPRVASMLKSLQEMCNGKAECNITPEMVQMTRAECVGVKRLDVQLKCELTTSKPSKLWAYLDRHICCFWNFIFIIFKVAL